MVVFWHKVYIAYPKDLRSADFDSGINFISSFGFAKSFGSAYACY